MRNKDIPCLSLSGIFTTAPNIYSWMLTVCNIQPIRVHSRSFAANLAFVFLFALAGAAWGDEAPILRVNPGGHTAQVRAIQFTPDGQQLISAGFDKVARVWNLRTGRQSAIRFQIGPDLDGAVKSAVISPDPASHLLALGLTSSHGNILLLDYATGKLVGKLSGHAARIQTAHGDLLNTVTGLAFSGDGKTLASCDADGVVRLWDVAGQKSLHEWSLKDRQSRPYLAGVALSPDGSQLAVASNHETTRNAFGGDVLVWDTHTFKQTQKWQWRDLINCLAWSSQNVLAFGSRDGTIQIWNARTASKPEPLPRQKDTVVCLAFSPDGRELLSGGGEGGQDLSASVWTGPDFHLTRTYLSHAAPIFACALAPDGAQAATGDLFGTVHVWKTDTGDEVRALQGTGKPTFAVAWSPDNAQVAWNTTFKSAKLEAGFDLSRAVPADAFDPTLPWKGGETQGAGGQINIAFDNASLTMGEKPGGKGGNPKRISAQTGDLFRCATYAPEGSVIVGSDQYLALYARPDGPPTRLFEGHEGPVTAVAVSPNGKFLASASMDQTVRVWSLDPKDEVVVLGRRVVRPLLSIFQANDDDWVAWTPQGYYNASATGDRLIGWHVNHGLDKLPDYYSADRFAPLLYRPDIIFYQFRTGSLVEALQEADKARGKQTVAYDINQDLTKLAPRPVAIQFPAEGSAVDSPELTLGVKYEGEAQKSVSVGAVVLEAPSARSVVEVDAGAAANGQKLTVPLVPGRNTIRVYAVNAQGVRGLASELHVTYNAPAGEEAGPHFDTLHLLTIGIGKFPKLDEKWQLGYTTQDAKAVDALYRAQQDKLFSHVDAKSLLDSEATGDNIMRSIEDLSKQVGKKKRDFVVLFVSSHGFPGGPDKTSLFFAPSNIDASSQAKMEETGVAWNKIIEQLKQLPCPVLLLIDTCHSGGVGIELFRSFDPVKGRGFDPRREAIREATESGLYVLSACRPTEQSLETEAWMHGAFTKAFLEMGQAQNKARVDPDGVIIFRNAFDYVFNRVRELVSPGKQSPKLYEPLDSAGDLPLLKVR